MNRIKDYLRALRVHQWTKNVVVLAAFFFAFWDRKRAVPLAISDLWRAIPAMMLFCMASSAIYLINDIRDLAADRAHPLKQYRPIAAGRIPVPVAAVLAFVLLAVALIGARLLAFDFFWVVLAYVVLQVIYTFGLKKIALVDVLVIAGGFVLRAIAGGAALTDVAVSPWLLLCTFLLALFLGLCKRRHEKYLMEGADGDSRASLGNYDTRLLDQLIAITSGATIVCYAIYTLWPDTVLKFGTSALGFTIPFVIFGIFRYLDLVYRQAKGDRPEKILLSDAPLIVAIGLYVVTAVVILKVTAG